MTSQCIILIASKISRTNAVNSEKKNCQRHISLYSTDINFPESAPCTRNKTNKNQPSNIF